MLARQFVPRRGVRRIDTHATSTDELRQVDALQHELDEGPCLDALQREDTVRSNDLSAGDIHDGLALAAHVGVALAAAQEVENLEKALGGRTVIGQATGMLMERFDMSSDRAFSVLSRMSQQRNVKLRQLAEQIVTTRSMPKP